MTAATMAGKRFLYAEYEITTGRRGLYAQRIDGHVALTDAPLQEQGEERVYLVERHVASLAELDGLCAAYIKDATRSDEPAILASRRRLAALAEDNR